MPSSGCAPTKPKAKIAQELRTLAQVLEEAAHAELPQEQTQYLMQYYVPILKQNHPDDHPKRLRDLEHFQGMMERYRSLETFAERHGAGAAQR